jgi:hypothetical protein
MKIRKEKLPSKTLSLLNDYLLLPFKHQRVACPYWINDLSKGIKGPFSGKGTPRQIVSVAYRRAKALKINLDSLNKEELIVFLMDNRIGVDCSGFVFHLLNSLDKEKGGDGISRKYLKNIEIPGWRASWRVSADMLSSEEFTRKIKLEDIRPGDMIRLLKGKHVAFVVEVNTDSIVYAHSSTFTMKRGCHLGKILIKNRDKELENQSWEELSMNGKNYKDFAFFPDSGDSVVRQVWWK